MAQTVIFLHVPRTAGTSLGSILGRQYPKGSIFRGGLLKDEDLASFRALDRGRRESLALVDGHMLFGLHEDIPGDSTYITFLRSPVDRVVSYFFYLKRRPQTPLFERIEAQNIDLRAFVERGEARLHTHDGATRMISGGGLDEFDEDPDGMLERAKANLESSFSCVGLSERFDESALLLKAELGWTRPVMYARKNVTAARTSLDDLSSVERASIERVNERDMELYEFAKSLFEQRLAAHSSIDGDLARLRRMNALYRPAAGVKARVLGRIR